MLIETYSPEETRALGRRLGEAAGPGQVYALDGDLGCGKTVLTQGFAAGLGIEERVTSPTFTILQVYEEGRLPLCHFDVYRISDPDEMDEIGYEECVDGDGVCLIEWASRIGDLLPRDTIFITIRRKTGCGDDYREIRIEGLPGPADSGKE